MQKEIYKEDYFGNLMSVLIDQARKLLPEFMPTEVLYKVQNDMCKAGNWLDKVPLGMIIYTVPQDSIVKLQQEAIPEYRRLAANLIDKFISEFELQGGNRRDITEKYESIYKWKKEKLLVLITVEQRLQMFYHIMISFSKQLWKALR